MTCPNCPIVPVVSRRLARRVLAEVPEERRLPLTQMAMRWLCERHEGLTIYEGIYGRPYTHDEKYLIAQETDYVARLLCPFWEGLECKLGGLGPHYNRAEDGQKAPYGWLPTLVAITWAKKLMRELVKQGAIADAKVALLNRNEFFLSREVVKELQAASVL